jgi:hypothetical protein
MNIFKQIVNDILTAVWHVPELLGFESTGAFANAISQL